MFLCIGECADESELRSAAPVPAPQLKHINDNINNNNQNNEQRSESYALKALARAAVGAGLVAIGLAQIRRAVGGKLRLQ